MSPSAFIIDIDGTPSDITAAKELGFSSVAVATGNYATEELLKDNPTLVLPDLRCYDIDNSVDCGNFKHRIVVLENSGKDDLITRIIYRIFSC